MAEMIPEHPKVYEINTALWLTELSGKYGRRVDLGTVPAEEWNELGRLGFDFVWLMGVWKRSRMGVEIFKGVEEYERFKPVFNAALPGWRDEDLVGSPYSVADYSPDDLAGGWEGLDKARGKLRERGMGLILDFVPNHTAPDHPWAASNPDYYILGSDADYKVNPGLFTPVETRGRTFYIARGRDPFFPPWTDTIQLNYFNLDARAALICELKNIAAHADGLRCDMAMLVLNGVFHDTWKDFLRGVERPAEEFWTEVNRALPGTVLIAEAYWDTERYLQHLGFHYVYDKILYDSLKDRHPRDVLSHLKADGDYQQRLLRFIENHDEKRAAEAFGKERLAPAVTVYSTLPGMRLYHHGQLDGRRTRLPIQLRRERHEDPDPEIRALYERILSITGQEVFRSGSWELREVLSEFDNTHEDLIAYLWRRGDVLKLVVVNLQEGLSQGRIVLAGDLSADMNYVLRDELNGKQYARSGREMTGRGLHVLLGGYRSHVFDIAEKAD